MRFTKMQGCGNDYIYVNGFEEHIPDSEKPELARRLSDRHFGIGSDGLIFINPAQEADFEMEMYNADGSRSEMCGNGIRCVGKFVYDKGLTDKRHISVVSAGQVKFLDLTVEEDGSHGGRGGVSRVRVNMGSPILDSVLIPVDAVGDRVVDEPISVGGRGYRMTCVSMGNPHAVVFARDVAGMPLEQIGPLFENHRRFPNRTNTEFVEILNRKSCFMRVWERGSGETFACGTGCCAVAVAGVLNDLTDSDVTVKLLGGELFIEWDREANLVYMTGPAVTVFEGSV
ncbi:MAG: diaminopimelate epimerase [Lachnospiraceae bacterium]|nr:diaminopimelate epimerase [uncultured Acetatifactor sp.]MCI9231490.1 diaminopimelate epimerase [Lachnospiraceae bacterium]